MTWRAPTHSWATQCDVQQVVRVHCMRKSDVWGVRFTLSVGYSRSPSDVSETYCNKQFKTNELNSWAPPAFGRVPVPPGITWGRRVPSKRNRFCMFFSWFSVETVHYCDCCSEVWSKSHRCILARFVQWDIPVFPISLMFLRGWAVGVVFLCQLIHFDALLFGPANLELRITIYLVL